MNQFGDQLGAKISTNLSKKTAFSWNRHRATRYRLSVWVDACEVMRNGFRVNRCVPISTWRAGETLEPPSSNVLSRRTIRRRAAIRLQK
jgi:hypothetical protein